MYLSCFGEGLYKKRALYSPNIILCPVLGPRKFIFLQDILERPKNSNTWDSGEVLKKTKVSQELWG
jgi:hypothetical protein